MTPKNYLSTVLTAQEVRAVELAVAAGLPVLIKGHSGPTGKSTMADYLRLQGVFVVEQYELDTGIKTLGDKESNSACVLITLNKTLTNFSSRPLYGKSHTPENGSQY